MKESLSLKQQNKTKPFIYLHVSTSFSILLSSRLNISGVTKSLEFAMQEKPEVLINLMVANWSVVSPEVEKCGIANNYANYNSKIRMT